MFNAWFFAAAGIAGLNWVSSGSGWKRVQYVTKVAALAALLVWFSLAGGWHGPLVWFGVGLCFGLAGDILLQHPERFFIAGLVAFLAGHVCYILGFLSTGLNLSETGLIFGVPYLAICAWIFSQLLRGMGRKPENSGMRIPVIGYGVVISAMAICAGLTLGDPRWPIAPATCCALGGVFFLVSDSVLALNRFVRPVKNVDVIVMVTYHLAQFLIAAGAILRLA